MKGQQSIDIDKVKDRTDSLRRGSAPPKVSSFLSFSGICKWAFFVSDVEEDDENDNVSPFSSEEWLFKYFQTSVLIENIR